MQAPAQQKRLWKGFNASRDIVTPPNDGPRLPALRMRNAPGVDTGNVTDHSLTAAAAAAAPDDDDHGGGVVVDDSGTADDGGSVAGQSIGGGNERAAMSSGGGGNSSGSARGSVTPLTTRRSSDGGIGMTSSTVRMRALARSRGVGARGTALTAKLRSLPPRSVFVWDLYPPGEALRAFVARKEMLLFFVGALCGHVDSLT